MRGSRREELGTGLEAGVLGLVAAAPHAVPVPVLGVLLRAGSDEAVLAGLRRMEQRGWVVSEQGPPPIQIDAGDERYPRAFLELLASEPMTTRARVTERGRRVLAIVMEECHRGVRGWHEEAAAAIWRGDTENPAAAYCLGQPKTPHNTNKREPPEDLP